MFRLPRSLRAAAALTVLVLTVGACATTRPLAEPFTPPSPAPASSLPATLAMVTVPDVRYSSLDAATGDLHQADLRVRIVERRKTTNYFPDTVLSQDPKPHADVEPETVVRLTVAKPPMCDPSYPDLCIPPFENVTCDTVFPNRNFKVKAPDPYRLDPDRDGIGCERRR